MPDLRYHRIVHQERQRQKQFLNLIPDRVQVKPILFVRVLIDLQLQEYGTKYWTAVCEVGMVMESFANYLRYFQKQELGPETKLIGRGVSSTCNSSGSAIWASAKNIKPLVDANCHTEAIEVVYHQSPIRFSPIHYRNPGSKSGSPSGQTILFGCPPEFRTVGGLTKIPPVLEYLLDSVHDWPITSLWSFAVGQKQGNRTTSSLYSKMETYWPLVNELEDAWTGVEERDRAIISNLVNHGFLIMVRLVRYTI